MTAPSVTRVPKSRKPKAGEELVDVVAGIPIVRAAKALRPVAVLDDILLELIDVDSNVRGDLGDLSQLTASIAELGVLEPVKVTRQPDGRYRLIMGQRRVAASRLVPGLLRIQALVEPPSDVDEKGARRSIEQLAENLQRKDLNAMEEAVALKDVLDATPGLTQEALADRLGMSRPWVSKALGLLEAAPAVQDYVREGKLTASHVTALRGLAPSTQNELAKETVQQGRSAHGLEQRVQDVKRSQEFQKEREAREREAAKKLDVGYQAAIAKKLAKVDKGMRIVVGSYYGSGASGHIVDLLKKAGFTNVETGNAASRSAAVGCDCVGWKVEAQYERLVITPACFNTAHLRAKTKADDDKRAAKYAGETRVKKALQDLGPGLFTGSATGRRLALEMALWHALGYQAGDWSEAHGGKRGNPWASIVALDDAALGTELGIATAKAFDDHYGYHIPWAEVGERIGAAAPNVQEPVSEFRKDVAEAEA